jgi:glycosyltransferase involved in cell wall biosynthesis
MNPSNPNLVSIVIPTYNGARFIAQALDSILAQTHPALEIIVVDDGSADQTRAICDRYPAVTYIYQSNQGVNAARNRGLRASQGQFLVFLDHDDRLLPTAIATGLAAAQTHPECAFVFGLARVIAADGSILEDHPATIPTADYARLLSSDLRICPPATVVFRRQPLESVGGFDITLRLVEDYALYLRLSREFPIYCHNQVIVEYRWHETNTSTRIVPMMQATFRLLDAQSAYVQQHPEYKAAYKRGKRQWRDFWCTALAYRTGHHLQKHQVITAIKVALVLMFYSPLLFLKKLMMLINLKFTDRTA